ncbi:hypothetical protein PVAND_015993 [Polypedilum vanderplanki]|uniref:Protein takeout-like n=1 Tax=Polypedilum vanderplanki TaxID=319348 RepID=A0A9J6BDV1_POLVA|nr:hypothetical protein PVAND_015993 [Polypedilum vanderplanki]
MKKIFIFFATCFYLIIAVAPDDFPSCSRRDPNLGKCIYNSIYKLKPLFASGKLSPELTIDPLDPFYLPSVTFGRTPISKVTFSDIYIIGATNFNLKEIKAHYENGYLKVMPRVEIDRIDVKTKYYFPAFPIAPVGHVQISLLNVKVHGDARVRLYQRNGKEYAKVEQAKLMFDKIRAGNLKFSVPFRGEKMRDAGFFINSFIKYFSEPVVKVLYRLLEKRIDQVHIDVVNEFIKNVPATYFLSE